MVENLNIITSEHFEYLKCYGAEIPVRTDGPGYEIEWKPLQIPDRLEILPGYVMPGPVQSSEYPRFQQWIEDTLRSEPRILRDTVRFLELKVAVCEWASLIEGENLPNSYARRHIRLEEGLKQLREGLEGLT